MAPIISVSVPVAIVIASGVASALLTGLVRAYAVRRNLLDTPNARSSHRIPTPKGGGIAVVAASLLAIVAGALLGPIDTRDAITLGAGLIVLAAVGWVDDLRGVTARVRLAIHIAVAAMTTAALGGLPTIDFGVASLHPGPFGYVLAIIGIVWSINLFNFMDGMDGLAGSQAVLIFGTSAALLWWTGSESLATISAIACATSAGFLGWNWPPAKIFLGDVGSGPIGYLVAGLAVASQNRGEVPLLVFAIIGGAFIADATATLIRRLRRGHSPAQAHRDHAYQRLSNVWAGHRPVTVRAAALTVGLSLLGAAGVIYPGLLLPAFMIACSILAWVLVASERRAPM